MKRLPIFTLALALGLLLTACGGGGGEQPMDKAAITARIAELKTELAKLEEQLAKVDTARKAERSALIQLTDLQPRTFKHFIEVQGSVESDKMAMVSSSMPGTITSLRVTEGQRVSRGTVIATIDNAVLNQSLKEVETQLATAKDLLARTQKLREQNIGTEVQLIQAKTQVESLEDRLATMKKQLELYVVTAPIDGVVDEVWPHQGEMAAPGVPIARIQGSGNFKVVVNVAEAYIGHIPTGDAVEIVFPDLNDLPVTGSVKSVSGTINPTARTFAVEINIPNNNPEIRANMIAFARFNDYTAPNAMVVPITVIKRNDDETYVFLAEQQNGKFVARRANVKQGKVNGSEVEILQGLSAGQKLISTGFQDVTDGQALDVASPQQ